ncbi:PTS mannitol-specific transporter subunit IIBC [Sinobaca sp. H24]|uniref:PTS mannitol-specific transporter subunit IIBC n=1 Tax=Sinobaca sp. H24 TaxID=2923376 RepID=UPI00207AA04A|nr:PTS mannitol-specific transporter subunit IIBC [Sinobaca sp. H24]
MSTAQGEVQSKGSMRAKVQRFGSYLSGMIMPNIGAFIAWGLITALFIADGPIPVANIADNVVGPMLTYLLPLLIGFTGGRMVHGDMRGGVVGAIATMGVIAGAEIPMFLGAMMMGPLGGYAIKKFDQAVDGKIKQGFEMLVNNFSSGIIGAILAIFGLYAVGPLVTGLTGVLGNGVDWIIGLGLLPLVSIFIEPAKVLFLNNAINHGILSPLALEQTAQAGQSVLFLLETNPGPGMGILLAYMVFGKGMARGSAAGASIIHFFGGIHEIYFPYVLMKPILILAAIGGGMAGIFTFQLFGAGLGAPPSPGSVIAYFALANPSNYLGLAAGILAATAVSFVIAGSILRFSKQEEEDLSGAAAKMESMKGKKSQAASQLGGSQPVASSAKKAQVNSIIFACDAGMGSSAMGASVMKDKVKKAGLDIHVTNSAINQIPDSADIIITHKDLTERAKAKRPDAEHISVDNFLGSPKYDELVEDLKGREDGGEQAQEKPLSEFDPQNVQKIIFACDAGMGSSAMGASVMKDKVKKAGLDIHVTNSAINQIPEDADIIITHKDLTERAKAKRPDAAHISVDNFLGSPKYDELVEGLKENKIS